MAVQNHQASAQMRGYLYQMRYALDLLLSDPNEQLSICIERFDDVALSNDGERPSTLIETKHHSGKHGDLSDKSVDLWRTIKVWIDYVTTHGLEDIKFVIVTTASVPENSAASYLRIGNKKSVTRAFDLLKQASEQSKSKTNADYYTSFSKMPTETMHKILDRATVVDNNKDILNVVEHIRQQIRYSTKPKFEDKVLEHIEGWWFEKTIEALSSVDPVFISQRDVRSKICDIAAKYLSDNLPIDIDFSEDIDIKSFPRNKQIFCEQLRLIAVKEKRLEVAIRDYYLAFTQRNKWIQDELLYIDELEKYEYRLIDEWEHLFAQMGDDLNANSDEVKKQEAGRNLYSQIEHHKDIRIRPLCSDAFVMRGSYHILANNLRVGWHPDFAQRLLTVIEGGE